MTRIRTRFHAFLCAASGRPFRAGLVATAIALLQLSPAGAAEWPRGAVRLVVPIAPGGGTDAAVRMLAAKLQEDLGKPFVVVNQPAGGGAVALDTVDRARPDGQMLLFFNTALVHRYHTGLIAQSPAADFTTLGYFPLKASYCLSVAQASPYGDLAALIAAAKAAPDSITFGVQLKSATHFGAALIAQKTGAGFRLVQGGGDNDLTLGIEGGNIDTGLVSCATALQHRDAGKLRILATLSRTDAPDPAVADLPTFAAAGYPDVHFSLDFMLLGPKGMAPELVSRINAGFAAALADPALAEQLTKMRIPMEALGPDESAAALRDLDTEVTGLARTLGFN